jgi:hypothetical protein
MTRRKAAAGMVAICVLAAGCGGGSPAISVGAGNTLRADVLALTQAAAAHRWNAADQALAQLRGDLTAAVNVGAVNADRAHAIRADVDAIAADLAAHRVATTPKPRTSSTAPKPPKPPTTNPKPQPRPRQHHGPGHGHDNGHGHGGEGGD